MNVSSIFDNALNNHFALGAFNFASLDVLSAIKEAAIENKSPVILAASESAIKFIGEGNVKHLIIATKKLEFPFIFHLDHGKSFESCKNAISLGFDSVMIDASALPFDENVALTKQVVDYAHSNNIWVEAELGRLAGIEDETTADNGIFTDPVKAKKFVELTGVDALAIAIGTSHGAYKFSGESHLRFDILEEIEKQLPHFPLVLHGASSINEDELELLNKFGGQVKGAKGVDDNLLRRCSAEHNICKINCDSDLRIAFSAGVRKNLLEHPENIDYRKYLQEGKDEVKKIVSDKITNVFLSNNNI